MVRILLLLLTVLAAPAAAEPDARSLRDEADAARATLEARASWSDEERLPDAEALDGEFAAAVAGYEAAIAAGAGTDIEAWSRLQLAGMHAWRRSWPEAVAQAEAVALAFPGTPREQDARFTVALLELAQGAEESGLESLAAVPTVTAPGIDRHAAAAALAGHIEERTVAAEATAKEHRAQDEEDAAHHRERAKKEFIPLPEYRPDPFLQRFGRYLIGVGLLFLIAVFMVKPMPEARQAEALKGPPAIGCGVFLLVVLVLVVLPHCKDRGEPVAPAPTPTPAPRHAELSVTRAAIIHHQAEGDVDVQLGHAQAWLPVDFALDWEEAGRHRRRDGHRLTVSWDFGDGTTGEGSRVSHVFGTGAAGVRTVTATVTCRRGRDRLEASSDPLTLHVMDGIEIRRIGEESPPVHHRLSFNDSATVKATVLPTSLPADCDDHIDWQVRIGDRWRLALDDGSPTLSLPGEDWPRSNEAWGPTTLMASVDGASPGSGLNDEAELVHGASALLVAESPLLRYYEAGGQQNPSDRANRAFYNRSSSAAEAQPPAAEGASAESAAPASIDTPWTPPGVLDGPLGRPGGSSGPTAPDWSHPGPNWRAR